jgi:murein L,D-transpeptidase YafK
MSRPLSAALLTVLSLTLAGPDADATSKRPQSREGRAAEKAHERLDPILKAKRLAFGDELFLRVFKEEAQLETWLRSDGRFEHLKTYPICAASGELGPKERVGDEQVPEGFYAVGPTSLNPASAYHLSFNIGYPNALDRSLHRTGSLIMIHGDCVSIGCMAMTDPGIQEIYSLTKAALDKGQGRVPVHIFPFRMTAANMKRHQASKWIDFWRTLKVGYDHFEAKRIPPAVGVKDGRYTFADDP